MSVLCVLEQRGGKWMQISLESLTAATQLAQTLGVPVSAVVLGSDASSLATDATRFGVDRVFCLEHELLSQYTPDGYTSALEQLIRSQSPDAVVFPHTYQVRDYAPKLATRLGKPLVTDIVGLNKSAQHPACIRQLFQGKLNADLMLENGLAFVSVQAGAFSAAQPAASQAVVEQFPVTLDAGSIRSKPEPPFQEAQRSVDLGAAQIIVSVGRGIKEKENLPLVEELAQVLGAELAASRPICDNGWLPMDRQVGSSGQTVAPKVYLAVGISGAIQHLVGMKGSQTVVAINKDENAPIFETADYAAVGDLFEIVPALIAEIRKAKA